MAASAPVSRRYVSAVYEDKYFPEKNATIPFKWETSPGKPKYDGDDDDDECNESYTSIQKDNHQCLQESHIHTSHEPGVHVAHVHTSHMVGHVRGGATSIYPLRPPPKVTPAKPLHVKDLLLNAGSVCDHALFDDPFDDDYHCPLKTYPHGSFSQLSLRFRSLKASTVVPICKNHPVMKQSGNPSADKSQASPLFVVHGGGPALQGRSQSFNHGAIAAAKRAANHSDVAAGDASVYVPGRRCNSFSLHSSAHHSAIHRDNRAQDDDDVDDTSSMAAAAVWAGACMLVATAAHDVVPTDHHQHGPCRVAMKLRDLMQQSTNLSELELPTMMKLKEGGGKMMNENLAQLALYHATITPAAKRETGEEEAAEAFLREGIRKSCAHDDDDDVEDEPMKEKVTQEGDDQPGKLVKRKSFLKVFKNECIACWCPSPTL